MKNKSIYRSYQYWKQLNSITKDPNYDLITQNGIIRHFIVFIEAEEVRKLVIPIGITRSERVNSNFTITDFILGNMEVVPDMKTFIIAAFMRLENK